MSKVPASNRTIDINDNLAPDRWIDEKFQPFSGNLTDHETTVANELPPIINDDDTAGLWQDIFKTIDGEGKKIEGLRIEMKEPFLQGGRKVDGKAKNLSDRVTTLKSKIGGVLQDYLRRKAAEARRKEEERAAALRAEQKRLADEAAERQRKADELAEANKPKRSATEQAKADAATDAANLAGMEAFESEANANSRSADFARTRSTEGSLGTLADGWSFRIDSIESVKGNKLWSLISRAEKERAIKQFIKMNAPRQLAEGQDWQPIEGVVFFRTTKLQVR